MTGTGGEIATVFQLPAIGEARLPDPSNRLGWPPPFEYTPAISFFAPFDESRYTLSVLTVPVKNAVCSKASAWPALSLSRVAVTEEMPINCVCAGANAAATHNRGNNRIAYRMVCPRERNDLFRHCGPGDGRGQ